MKKHPKFYQHVIESKSSSIVFDVPTGNSKEINEVEDLPTDGPCITYEQGHEQKCSIYSLASALSYIGDKKMEDFIVCLEPTHYNDEKFSFIINIMTKNLNKDKEKSLIHYTSTYLRNDELQVLWLLKNMTTENLRLVRITASHAIKIYGQWIFDTNHTNGLPLCQTNMNWCSDLSEEDEDLQSVLCVVQFHISPILRKLLEKQV